MTAHTIPLEERGFLRPRISVPAIRSWSERGGSALAAPSAASGCRSPRARTGRASWSGAAPTAERTPDPRRSGARRSPQRP